MRETNALGTSVYLYTPSLPLTEPNVLHFGLSTALHTNQTKSLYMIPNLIGGACKILLPESALTSVPIQSLRPQAHPLHNPSSSATHHTCACRHKHLHAIVIDFAHPRSDSDQVIRPCHLMSFSIQSIGASMLQRKTRQVQCRWRSDCSTPVP